MPKKPNAEDEDTFSADEAKRRFERAVDIALHTAPMPKPTKPTKPKKKPK